MPLCVPHMKHYVIASDDNWFELPDTPQSRTEAIHVAEDFSSRGWQGETIRFVTTDNIAISDDEVCSLELARIQLHRYSQGQWGLAEADILSNRERYLSDFSPTERDVSLWLEQAFTRLGAPPGKIERLQTVEGETIQVFSETNSFPRMVIDVKLAKDGEANSVFRLSSIGKYNGVIHLSAEIPDRGLLAAALRPFIA